MEKMLSTREVARLLGVNEKMVYTLIAEKGLPASKLTGKWIFPSRLVEQWVESRTVNLPERAKAASMEGGEGALVLAGSDDPLLDRALSLFMRLNPDQVAVFGNTGSLGGIRALRQGLCHMAASHLAEDQGEEYNFGHVAHEMDTPPVLVEFCRREQGVLLPPGNPQKIQDVRDLADRNITVANRPLGTGTRLRFDRELQLAGVKPSSVPGYEHEVARHLDVGLEVLTGRAGAGPAIRAVAGLLALDFLSLGWERFDLVIPRETFPDKDIQLFLNMLHTPEFKALANEFEGYDVSSGGKTLFPKS